MTTHFTLKDLTYSAVAVANGIDNTPPDAARRALRLLAINLLEPLRLAYGKTIAITSGYRAPAVNARIKGAALNSQHTRGEAADCYTGEDPQLLLQTLLRSGLDFDQAIIYEGKNILHLSCRAEGNRREVLII